MRDTLDGWVDSAYCDDVIVAVGDFEDNYRDVIYDDYKRSTSRVGGRKDRVEFYEDAKRFMMGLPEASVAQGVEADDLLGHWGTTLSGRAVIVSVDKDLQQIPGLHYNPRTDTFSEMSAEASRRFFLAQMLSGDSIDNIPGVPGIGPVKATKALASEEGLVRPAELVKSMYQEAFAEDWESQFLSNGKMLYIQRKPDSHFTFNLFEDMFNDATSNTGPIRGLGSGGNNPVESLALPG